MPMYRRVNETFFDRWSPEMAYVLGFIFADGYVHTNKRGSAYLGFVSTDLEILKKIKKVMDSDHVITLRKRSNMKLAWKDLWRLQIGNKHIFSKLHQFGIFQNKSLTIAMPTIPQNMLGHFVRGYFDGDGNVYFNKLKVKDRKNPKWIFSSRFISGSRNFLLKLQKALSGYTNGGFIVVKRKGEIISGYELCYSHRDSLALYRLMYNNAVASKLFLERKHRLFTRAVTTLYGNMRA